MIINDGVKIYTLHTVTMIYELDNYLESYDKIHANKKVP